MWYWTRTINPPKDELKDIQKRINGYLVANIKMPEYAYGGIKNKDTIRNAQFHKGQKYIFQTDLKDFFPYITHKTVYAMYVRVGFSHDVASLLTKLTTYKSGITEVTGVKMLNNTMTVTDKFSNAYTKETDETSPRAKGMRNYKERIKKISKQKRGQMFKKQLEI